MSQAEAASPQLTVYILLLQKISSKDVVILQESLFIYLFINISAMTLHNIKLVIKLKIELVKIKIFFFPNTL